MSGPLSPYVAGFVSGFRRAARAPGETAVRLGFFAVILLVLAGMWRAAVEARGGQLVGYDFRSLFWYLVAAQCAFSGVRLRTIEEIGDDIGSGAVAVAMLRPASVVGMRIAIDCGEAALRILGGVVIGTAMSLAIAGPPPTPAVLLALPALALGSACNIASQQAFGGIAFWLLDAKSAWFLYQKLVFLPGGMLLPLEMLPHSVATVCRVLPFAAMAYVPGRLASGHADPGLLLGQVAWLAVLLLVAFGVFAAGERRLQTLGG